MAFSVCVYCGARSGGEPAYAEAAAELGVALAKRGWRLVYGGGSVGLMGVAARAALDAAGE
ncbi:MAG: TIGR00730 family Rossman fold protein, partial [Oscillochloris sp.]|nr:TIGR00730 family Rossman fold protein [Oscillochloris sp.]